jgi:hypothetical protein
MTGHGKNKLGYNAIDGDLPGMPSARRYNEIAPARGISGDIMNSTRNFWPLDYDPEEEIYESLSWDLPGFKAVRDVRKRQLSPKRTASFCKGPHV